MELKELADRVEDFDELSTREKCRLFGWYLHTYKNMEFFVTRDISDCYKTLHIQVPNVAQTLQRMHNVRKPPDLSRHRLGYKLLRGVRTEFDKKYSEHPSTTLVSNTLKELPDKIPDVAEKSFFLEALSCYQVKAFRACIVMTWNLAFDHLLRWILQDAARLTKFNAALAVRFPKKGLTIVLREDFEDLKESEVVDVCNTAKITTGNTIKILKEKLTKRNMAAHPSQVIVTQFQADDVVTDLVNNVILALT